MINKQKLTESAAILTFGNVTILVGCPADLVKIFNAYQKELPNVFVIPDDFFLYGTYLVALEFPFYAGVFSKTYKEGHKISVIATEKSISRIKTILSQTIHGPSAEEMRAWKIDENLIEQYQKQSKYLQANVPTIEDLFEFIPFKENKAEIEQIRIQKIGKNKFEFEYKQQKESVDLNIKRFSKSFFAIPQTAPIYPVKTGVFINGIGNGFSPFEENSALTVFENYLPISIDGSQWNREKYENAGFKQSEIVASIITHVHDDHSNILDMLLEGKKQNILTTAVIYESFLTKTAAVLDMDRNKIRENFKFIELTPGTTIRFYGINFKAHETMHSIPTIGVKINDSIMVAGDGLWGTRLKEAFEAGIVSKESYEMLQAIPYDKNIKFLFMDAGGSALHPDIKELATLPEENKKNIYLNHITRSEVLSEYNLKSAQSGDFIILKRGAFAFYSNIILHFVMSDFSRLIPPEWLKIFFATGKIIKLKPYIDTDLSGYAVLVLSGTVRSSLYSSDRIFSSGDLLTPNSEQHITSPVISTVLLIPHNLFNEFIVQEDREYCFEKFSILNDYILSCDALWRFDQKTIIKLLDDINIVNLEEAQSYSSDTELFLPLDGELSQNGIDLELGELYSFKDGSVTAIESSKIITFKEKELREQLSNIYIDGLLEKRTL